jgi:protein disulfide-isomerase
MKKTIGSVMVAALLCSMAWAVDGTWSSDLAKSKSVAKENNLPILALFEGSDWCPWCKKLEREVFSTDEFKAYAKSNLVLFIADFPMKTPLAKEIATQNQDLADKYNVEGFPTVILMSADGKELGRLGYSEGGGKAYVEQIKELLKRK